MRNNLFHHYYEVTLKCCMCINVLLPIRFISKTDFKNLQSLEICGGGLTDTGVKNIQGLASLTLLNLSQNCNLTDKTLELISGIILLLFTNFCFPCSRQQVKYIDKSKYFLFQVDPTQIIFKHFLPCNKGASSF